jgi:hypothetical protein
MIEGILHLFSLPSGVDKARVVEGIEKAFEKNRCGRVLGSGTSFANDGTVAVEIGAYDRDMANDVISRVCRKLKCRDNEIAWD